MLVANASTSRSGRFAAIVSVVVANADLCFRPAREAATPTSV
jgi:hypothetical protein